jgi:hypothetical protein
MQLDEPIKQILKDTRPIWDRGSTRPCVRESFRKVIECRTPVSSRAPRLRSNLHFPTTNQASIAKRFHYETRYSQ